MLFRRYALPSLLAVAALAVWWCRPEASLSSSVYPARGASTARASSFLTSGGSSTVASLSASAATPAISDSEFRRRETLSRLAYAQGWEGAQPKELAAFRDWAARYHAAGSAVSRAALEAEGLALAQARRPAMRTLIERDPRQALALTVPAVIRQEMPAAILAELETRVAGRGDLMVLETSAPDEARGQASRSRRVVALGGQSYTAYVYGRSEGLLTKEGASLHGIALDRQFALHESPLRVLEPGEIPPAAADAHCPVSKLPVAALTAGAGVNVSAITVVQADGHLWEFCAAEGMLETLEARLERAQSGSGPKMVEALGSGETTTPTAPPTAADAPTPHTVGNQRVLVIRVDFSDFPGEPVSAPAAQEMMDNQVRPYFESASYGAATLTSTISTSLYRMPTTGRSYAINDNDTQLHTDARNAAAANYTLSAYDRIVVVFPNIGSSRVSGSLITFGGQATVGGSSVWINGTFSLRLLMHELGHTFGLKHANLWQVNDNNTVSNNGISGEYKDPLDAMGDASGADSRFHYNVWSKNRIGWLPDTSVTTVATSGKYRIYRFDHKDALGLKQPLALRIFRDGVRWYWIGLRNNFSPAFFTGLNIIWGTNSLQQTNLLDTRTPGRDTTDASLPLNETFTDPVYGVTIKAVANGGDDPQQWVDVEVTLPDRAPPNVATAWGREGTFFYDGNGAATTPAPESLVPPGVAGLRMIAGGDSHAVALKTDGTVVVWGRDYEGQTGIPIGLADVVSVAAGGNACGAVKSDGTVRVWGDTTSGQRSIPEGLTDVKQLALGANHAVALKTDGTVVAWGGNASGQATVPAGLTDVVAITAGNGGSIAVRRNGTVVGWGSTNFRTVPTTATNVVAVSSCGSLSGGTHIVALKADGTVIAWGNNANGQSTVPTGLTDVIAVAAGGFHSLALKADGSIVGWGSTVSGAVVVPAQLPRSFAVAASMRGSFAVTGAHVYFTAQPVAQSVAAGAGATFSVTAVGATSLTYQWRKDGVPIVGATGSTLTLSNVGATAAASYDVVVSDGTNSRATTAVRLTVAPPPVVTPPVVTPPVPGAEVARISNLSIRSNAGSASSTLIVGFVVGGSGTTGAKPLLIRGIGPTLTNFGVAGALADPKLELYNSASVKTQENDNWNGDTTITTVGAQLGAFSLTVPASKDAALYTNPALAPGSYSAQISGVGGTTGIALAEIYDASSGGANFTSTTPRLINVSARTVSGTNADVLIAGFVVAGPAGSTKKVLLRGIGPTLASFGVTGVLADPKLELYNSASVMIQNNDNWGGTAELTSTFTSVGAFTLGAAAKDAALVATLAPGTYTVQVAGVGGTTGVALVELYEVP